MERHLVLVDLYWTRDKDPRVPLGHASLLAALEQHANLSVTSRCYAVNASTTADFIVTDLLDAIDGDERADIAIGAYVWGEALLRSVLLRLRVAGFTGRIILGGPQISYSGAGLEALYPEADCFIRGYGEEALAKVASSDRVPNISGVHRAGSHDACEQSSVALDLLPSPWLTGLIPLEGQKFLRWETQRGCPFRCSFCQHREAGARLKRRALSSERVRDEIDLFCHHNRRGDAQTIAVLDPIFNQGESDAILRRFAEKEFAGRLSLQCRAEMCGAGFLDAAATLDVCLEFGLQTIHKSESRAVERGNNIPKVQAALRGVRDRGLDHEVSLIFGLPEQTLASFEETVRWCLREEIPVIKAFPLMLLRGTRLDVERNRWGLVDSGDEMAFVLSSDSFSYADWRGMAQLSEALKRTEGAHPAFSDLQALSRSIEPDLFRFQPSPKT